MSLIDPPDETARIAIIGGTGVYDPKIFLDSKDIKIFTPYGQTSPFLSIGFHGNERVAFLPRHGRDHSIPPHMINYRANVHALKQLRVERIISVSSVGSLREELRPGNFVIPDQFIDRTKNRADTFFEAGQVVHVSSADPFCSEMRKNYEGSANRLGIKVHSGGTYVCINGPRFSSRAESRLFRNWGADIVGMTLYPEAILAREAQMCYASVSMVTDFDVWAEKPVSATEVSETLRNNIESAKRIILDTIETLPKERSCGCANALSGAVL